MMAAAGKMKVLIVEDEALIVMDLEAVVEDCGHVVVGDVDHPAKIEKLSSATGVDVAFVDIHLASDSSGFDACQEVLRYWPNAIVIYVTANPLRIPADFAGAHGVIAKPFSRSGLTNAVRYLGEGVLTPPPSMKLPSCLAPAPAFSDRWS